jgi:hypothetical protein
MYRLVMLILPTLMAPESGVPVVPVARLVQARQVSAVRLASPVLQAVLVMTLPALVARAARVVPAALVQMVAQAVLAVRVVMLVTVPLVWSSCRVR